MEVAEQILPGSLARMVDAFESQQKHDQKMDVELFELHRLNQKQERSDSWKAFLVIMIFGLALIALLFRELRTEASILGGFFVALAALARVLRK